MSMKKIKESILSLCKSLGAVVLAHPAVTVILLYSSIVLIASDSSSWVRWMYPSVTAPIFVVLAVAMDYLLPGKLKALSWLTIPMMALTVLIPGLGDWPGTTSFIVTIVAILPLTVLLFRRSFDNVSFIKNAVWTVWSGMLSLAVGALLYLVISGILVSIDFLFDVEISEFIIPAALSFVIVTPMLFISYSEKEDVSAISKVVELITNWVITPALLVYTLILLAYIVKIVVTWSLPCGGVALMCLIWGLVSLYVAAIQPVLSKHPFSWFVKIYGYVAVPFVALLWVAILRRVLDYGITPDRYFLILSGIIMTVFIAISLFSRKDGYFKTAFVALVLLLIGLVAPGVNYNASTIHSQTHRIKVAARELGLLREDGTLIIPQKNSSDSTYLKGTKQIYESLKQLEKEDAVLAGFGVEQITSFRVLSDAEEDTVFLNADRIGTKISTEGFEYVSLEKGLDINLDGDRQYTVVGQERLYLDDFFAAQLAKIGLTDITDLSELKDHQEEFLVYDGKDYRLYFDHITITRDKDGKMIADEYSFLCTAILFR